MYLLLSNLLYKEKSEKCGMQMSLVDFYYVRPK